MKSIKKIFVVFVLFVMLCTNVYAETSYSSYIMKNVYNISDDKLLYRVETHEGKLEVKHNEVVLMIDASTSNGANWNKIKDMLIGIGDDLLDGSGKYQISLMGFAFSDKLVVTGIKSKEELDAVLKRDDLNFMYGRSSSNAEAGVVGVKEYLESIENLNEATVIFVSDSRTNMSEEEMPWENYCDDANAGWRYRGMSVASLASMLVTGYEIPNILEKGITNPATKAVFGFDYDSLVKNYLKEDSAKEFLELKKSELVTLEETVANDGSEANIKKRDDKKTEVERTEKVIANFKDGVYTKSFDKELAGVITGILGDIPYDIVLDKAAEDSNAYKTWSNAIWKDAYEQAGLVYGKDKAYPISVVEQALVDYEKKNNYVIADVFYYMIFGYSSPNKFVDGKDNGKRASIATEALAGMKNVTDVYMIGYGGSAEKSWMNPASGHKNAVTNEKIKYLHLNNVSESMELSKPIVDDIEETGYFDAVVTDYLSKWGLLQLESIKLFKEEEIIYQFNKETGDYEWLIPEDERPVKGNPIEVSIISEDELEQAGKDVVGNTNGEVYKIVWKIKDGELLKTDKYHIEYEVKLDVEEEGFEYDAEYPTNGESVVGYSPKEGQEAIVENIYIPSVSMKVEEIPDTSDGIYTYLVMFSVSVLAVGVLISKKVVKE